MAFYIMAHRSSASVMGAASAPMRDNGAVRYFATIEAAREEAARLNRECASPNVHYVAARESGGPA